MTIKTEDGGALGVTAVPTETIFGGVGGAFLGLPGMEEVDPGHMWIYKIESGTTTLFAEIYVEKLPDTSLKENWYLFTTTGTHPVASTPFVKYVWPSYFDSATTAKNITMKFSYMGSAPKKADGTVETAAAYHTYLTAMGVTHTYIVSSPQVITP